MNYLIDEQAQLNKLEPLFKQLSDSNGRVAVDTEFFREKTYNAKLCLVQLGIDEHQYCIDVIAINDLTLLAELFANEKILKLFHAARQDLEILEQTLGVLPKPVFDTQLAAAFVGLDMQMGYSALVLKKLGIELAKSQARTDWTRRPLSAEQINYAGEDVAHLDALFELTTQTLNEQGKSVWFEEESQHYYDLQLYRNDPVEAYQRLSGGGLKLNQQYTLKALAEWRERAAQDRDIPRTWIVRDDALYDLAMRRPQTQKEVMSMKVLGRKSASYLSSQVVDIINNVEVGDKRIWNKIEPLDKRQKRQVGLMMKQLSKLAEQHSVAQGLLGTRKNVESLYRKRDSKKLLQGWRTDIVGKPLLALIDD